MPAESVHDLFQKVRNHPDFVFGVIFVEADFDNLLNDADFAAQVDTLKTNPKHAEECITAAGFEFIENTVGA